MKKIEIRRHGPAGADGNLTEEGRRIAREARETLEPPYDLYATSPKTRAIETLKELGGISYIIDDRLGTLPSDKLKRYEAKVERLRSTQGLTLLHAYFILEETKAILKEKGEEMLKGVKEISVRLKENGKALIVSHGGSIEPSFLLALQRPFTLDSLGGELAYCEGVELFIEKGRFLRGDVIRLSRIEIA